MDEDIDIEEHDMLDHPRIRNMFPDITTIKAEVEDYTEEETLIDIEEDLPYRSGPFIFEEDNNFKTFNNKIILGSKPSTSKFQIQETQQNADFAEPDFHETYNEEVEGNQEEGGTDNQEKSFQGLGVSETNILQTMLEQSGFQNKIILGSKARTTNSAEESYCGDEELILPEVSLILQDCKSFLENNPCFCKECQILFATDNDLNAHKATAHSFLIAVSKNKALKSTSKHLTYNGDCKNLTCNHCNVVFPNTIALLRHTYELLPGKFACDQCDLDFKNEAACKAHKATHYAEATEFANMVSPAGTYTVCKVCSCHFKWTVKLRAHMMSHHQWNETGDLKHEQTNLQCRWCPTKLMTSKGYNLHIQNCHPALYRRSYASFQSDSQFNQFKCPQCDMCFSSDYSVRIHLAAKHGKAGSVKDSKILAHVDKAPVKSKKLAISPNNDTFPLPKSTLFKCNKCHIHFISCAAAVIHSKSCLLKKGDFKCHQCRRTLTTQDKTCHYYQHSISVKFQVIETSRNVLNRILCKCNTCKICFDEKSFMAHHTDACYEETPSMQCPECNHRIHPKAMPLHNKIHASGLTSSDFIIIDYVHVKMSINEIDTRDSEEELKINTAKFKKIKVKAHQSKYAPLLKVNASKLVKYKGSLRRRRRLDELSYFYCPTCKCFMRQNRMRDGHCIGQCNTILKAIPCKYCGLRFTTKALLSHNNTHKKFPKLRLKDFNFTNIQTNKKINPPFPCFKICKLCKVAFFSVIALKNHACNAEKPKVCTHCNKTFSDLAYNLHVQFHEYPMKSKLNDTANEVNERNDKMSKINGNIPELIKKYESLKQVWNILFLCETCDIVIDSYDQVVEHCQDHYCNMESYNVTIEHCNICDLNFVDTCFEKHKELHSSDDFDKDSFKILEYKYENLLTDHWLDIFITLTKEQIDLILSKSMYKFTRCVRMKVVANGPSNLTLYQCGKCKVIVAPNMVTEHSQNVNDRCKNGKKFRCTICMLQFVYRSHKLAHENLHEVRNLHAKSFRMIEFHAEKQFRVTELKVNEVDELDIVEHKQKKDPNALKFIRCQHCGKLINKQKYKRHIQYHYYYDENKAKANVLNNPKIVHNFYKCNECKLCVSKKNLKVHYCDSNYKRKQCPKCFLYFRSQNLASHFKYHDNYKFNRSNMNVMYFENGVILKNNTKKSNKNVFVESNKLNNHVMTFYQCSQCKMCLCNKVNMVRHVCSTKIYKTTCELCGVTFMASRKVAHNELHAAKNFNSTNINIVQFKDRKICNPTKAVAQKRKPTPTYEETVAKQPRIDKTFNKSREDTGTEVLYRRIFAKRTRISKTEEKVNHNISLEKSIRESRRRIHNRHYKCTTCKLLFVFPTGLIEHGTECDSNREAVKCNTCGLVFHASEIDQHRKLQKCSIIMENTYILTIQQIGKSYNIDSNWIYQCLQCDIYNISYGGLHYHMSNNHRTKYAIKTCETCDVRFTSSSFTFHQKIHHATKATVFSDLSIAAVEETTLEKVLEDVPNERDVVYVDGTVKPPDLQKNGNDISDERDTEPVINEERKCCNKKTTGKHICFNDTGIYHCDVCGLNFMHPRSLERHLSYGKHNETHHTCPECTLSFTNISLKKHLTHHHSKTEADSKGKTSTDINDSIVESISRIFDDTQTNTRPIQAPDNISVISHLTLTKSTEINTGVHIEPKASLETSRDVMNKAEENISGTSDLRHVDDNVLSRSQVDPINRPKPVDNIPNENNTALNKNKLFKCSACDVYFLTANDCYEHTSFHTQLDPTEYIGCKICELQFCCEFLGRHMKSHREKTFCIDDLIVVEYRPNDSGELIVDTYLAMDRLKTKLVSTTTHFDTEEDKSISVDSTTTENVT